MTAAEQIERIFREKHGRVLAALISQFEDFDLAEDFYPYQAARADLLRRTGQREAAADAYRRALDLCGNRAERAYLQRRLDEIEHLVD